MKVDSRTSFSVDNKEGAIRSLAFIAAERFGLDTATADFCSAVRDARVFGRFSSTTADFCDLSLFVAAGEETIRTFASPAAERFGLDAVVTDFCSTFTDARVLGRFSVVGADSWIFSSIAR